MDDDPGANPPEPPTEPVTPAAPAPSSDAGRCSHTSSARPLRLQRRSRLAAPAPAPHAEHRHAASAAAATHHRAARPRRQLRQAADAHPAPAARPLHRLRARSGRCSSGSASCSSRIVGPACAADGDRRHLHRRLVVGAVPDHDLRARWWAAHWSGCSRTAPREKEDGGLMTPGTGQASSTVTRADIEAKLAADQGRHRHHHRGRRRRRPSRCSSSWASRVVVVRVPARPPARPQEEHHRRGPAGLMASRVSELPHRGRRGREAARVFRRGFAARVVGRLASTALRQGMRSGIPRLALRRGRRARAPHAAARSPHAKPTSSPLKLKPGDAVEIREIRARRSSAGTLALGAQIGPCGEGAAAQPAARARARPGR